MLTLYLVTCLLDGSNCYKHPEAYGLGIIECQIRAQQIAAQYVQSHPKRKIVRFECNIDVEI